MQSFRVLAELPRQVWVLCAATLVNRAGTMVLPFLVIYLTRELHLTAGEAGAMLALYGAGELVTAPVAGHLSDRFGPLRVMQGSLLASVLVMVAYPLARHFGAVAAATVALAVANGSFRPAALAMVSAMVDVRSRRPAFALHRLAVNLGMSMGPALGGVLATVSMPLLFYVNAGANLAAAVMMLVGLRPPQRPIAVGQGLPERAVFADRRMLYFVVALLPVAIVFFQHTGAMPLYVVRDLGLSERFFGLLFTLNTLIIVAIEVPLNAATMHWPYRRALALGSLLFALGFGALAVADSRASIALTVVVWTFGEMILFPAASAYVSELAPPSQQGAYMGLYTMGFNLALVAGPWLGTTLLDSGGNTTLWSFMLALGLLSCLLMLRAKPLASAGAPS